MKRTAGRGRLVFTSGFLAFVLTITLVSLAYRWQDRILPLLIGGATLGLGVLLLVRERNPGFLGAFEQSAFGSMRASGCEPAEASSERSAKAFWTMSVWVILAGASVYLVGMYLGSAAFLFLFYKVRGRQGWLKTLLLTTTVSGGFYLLFDVLLGLELFGGALFGAYVPPA